jgi:trehalose synthase
MRKEHRIIKVEDYEQHVGVTAVERVLKKAQKCRHLHVANVNSTFYGGGVAELLSSMTLLMNSAGIKAGWRVIQGAPDFFSITKKMHNALQGAEINLSKRKKEIYEAVAYENSLRNHMDHHSFVIIHDPQPLPMITHYRRNGPWVWRCHVDLTKPHLKLWNYLTRFIEQYDAVVFSLKEYRQELKTPQLFHFPGIDPFNLKNCEMSEANINERLGNYKIPTDLPLVVQVARFDRWKDPQGVIRAVKLARKEVDCTLVLLGNVATDDPEGPKVYESLLDEQDERILILSHQDSALVNALQRRAAVVLQKSLREGFGLTVTEAMWKGAAVIGGQVGGIRHQIENGVNGFLVSSVKEAAERLVQLLKDPKLRRRLGQKARQTVKKRFLLFNHLEHHLDLFGSFETIYRFKGSRSKAAR